VKEQSHKEEMSAALRGDFQRLRERGVAASLTPATPAAAAVEEVEAEVLTPDEQPPEREGVPTEPSEPAPDPSARDEPVDRAEALDEAADTAPEAADGKPEPRPGWLGRLLGR
jgi:hypothetical protein